MKHLDIRISGKVQGVSFRACTQEKARELGITGVVSNQSDGNVFVQAEGEEGQLRELLVWLNEGPPAAEVKSVQAEEGELSDFTDFSIGK